MEFASLYLMFLHQGWFVLVVFFGILVEENKTLRGLKLCPLPQLGWSEWKLLKLPKETKHPKPNSAFIWD